MDHSHHQTDHQMHDKHDGHSADMFRNKFWLSLVLTLPVLVYSTMIQNWFNFTPPIFIGSEYIPFLFSTVIFFYGGKVFIRGAWGELKAKKPGMMTLISLAIISSYIYSFATQFFIDGEDFFWELATLITIMLLGHWLEMNSIAKANNALDALSELLPDKAEKLIDNKPTQVLISELKINDLVLVRPGTNIPVDGVITDGTSSIDESAITGESKPVNKTVNDEVIAGTVNQDGSITIKITKLGDDTALAGIMRLVSEAQISKSNVQILADKAAFVLTIIAIVTSMVTFIYWFVSKDASFALERSVTVLIITCPHALGLAIPLVVSISTAISARNGLLVRKRLALESAHRLDWVLFDKTGTLTKGEHGVTDIWATKGYTKEDILRLTASLEQNSEHIIGKAIVNEANKRNIDLDKFKNFITIPGYGVKGELPGVAKLMATSYRFVKDNKLKVPDRISRQIKQQSKDGKTEVYLVKDDKQVVGAIALADIIREQSRQVIDKLKAINIKTAMITGDSEEVARYVSGQLGIDQYFAEVLPRDKAQKVKELQKNGKQVAMIGDGINDAPALTQANIGIAIGAGTDIAIKSADIILIKDDPQDIIKVINLSKATYKKMFQNLIWATGYNVVAIPLASGVLYFKGILLSPAVGAILMSLSTIFVAINAQLLRRIKI